MQSQQVDDLLYAVTQQSGNGIHGLLDSVYGFLQRRTDFYYEAEPGDKMGFPPGIAESMVSKFKTRLTLIGLPIFPQVPGGASGEVPTQARD